MAAARSRLDAEGVKISTFRWAIASFLAGVGSLALASIPLVAVCAGAGTVAFRQAVLAALVVAAGCLLVVVLTLDLLGARAGRDAPSRRPAQLRTSESGRAALPHGTGRRGAALSHRRG